MTPEEWERLQALLEAALDTPPHERRAFVDAACRDHATLAEELRSLLAESDDDSDTYALPAPWLSLLSTPEAPCFRRGDQVARRYRIDALLGRGGMGEVYEAWDQDLSIPVALKTLHVAVSTEEARRRLEMEGLLARTIWHPNVCRLYDLGCHREGEVDVWFLTMELLRGRTLAEVLRDEPRLPLDRVLALAEQMAAGLGAAHRSGIIHRDFKPANVLLVDAEIGEQAVVTDFGIARASSAAHGASPPDTEGGAVVGTPAYMSPEQHMSDAVGPAADIYALGVVLFEMVTGQLPLEERATRPRELRPELSEEWDRVILRCLERDPEKRFRRAEDVGEALAGRAPAVEINRPQSARVGSHNLPAERDPFVSREAELDELVINLSKSRLVTLVGAGGMGKTRLAIRCGWQTLHHWPGGVWFSDLTEARDESGLALCVARALGVELRPVDPVSQIGHALAARGRCLLILDNFEQLLPRGAAVVAQWLERAAETTLLVTSRQRLALDAQELVQRAEALAPEAGLRLFRVRSRWIRPDFQCTGPDEDAAREIVRLVDGMPLAIELAAGRIRVMSATQIVSEMRRRFSLLTGGGTARHATLAGTLEGSWELLSPFEQSAWAQLSVFEGGFTLEAAEAVLAFDSPAEAPKVTEVLQSLLEKNLLRTLVPASAERRGSAALRFGMLTSLQEYARMKLQGGVDDTARAREHASAPWDSALRRHAEYYARIVGDGASWRDLEADVENLAQAVRRAVEREDGRTAAAAYRGCYAVVSRTGPHNRLVDLGLEVLGTAGLEDRDRTRVLDALASAENSTGLSAASVAHRESALALCRKTGDRAGECEALSSLSLSFHLLGRQEEARGCAETAIAMSREIGAPDPECAALGFLGEVNMREGRMDEARQNWELALAVARRLGDRSREASNLINLGCLYFDDGRLEEAKRCFETALAIERQAGGRLAQGVALENLGHLCQMRGQPEEARARFEEGLAIHREVGYRRYEGSCLAGLGNLHRELGDHDRARACLESALAIHRETGNRPMEGRALSDLGLLDMEAGRLEQADQTFRRALAIAGDTQDRLLEGMTRSRVGALLRGSGRIDDARAEFAQSEAVLRPLGDLFELARILCMRADLELGSGDRALAVIIFDEAAQLAVRTESGPATEIGRMIAALRAGLDSRSEGSG